MWAWQVKHLLTSETHYGQRLQVDPAMHEAVLMTVRDATSNTLANQLSTVALANKDDPKGLPTNGDFFQLGFSQGLSINNITNLF